VKGELLSVEEIAQRSSAVEGYSEAEGKLQRSAEAGSEVQRRLQGRGLYLLMPFKDADSKIIIFYEILNANIINIISLCLRHDLHKL
jgi:hypothetical protein